MELALSMSSCEVLRIGTVPSGHDSPEIVHARNLTSTTMASDDDAPPMLGSYLIPGIKCCAIDRSRRARSKEKTSKEKRNDSISFGAARSHARGILELRSFF
ncbi:hypothetical protein GW17_00009985 [Ensete ventricosum]|nr:hypothetical protein GW17_00009985 [Ensete ventricosum]